MPDPAPNTITVARLPGGVWRTAIGPEGAVVEACAFRPEAALSRLCALLMAGGHDWGQGDPADDA